MSANKRGTPVVASSTAKRTKRDDSETLWSKTFKTFHERWMLSDAILVVGNKEFHVHRAVLGMCSPYFERLFISGEFIEKGSGKATLKDKRPEDIGELLLAVYPQFNHEINKENCPRLLPLSCEYLIDSLKERCIAFLTKYLKGDSVIPKEEILKNLVLLNDHALSPTLQEQCIALLSQKQYKLLKKVPLFQKLGMELKFKIAEKRLTRLENAPKYQPVPAKPAAVKVPYVTSSDSDSSLSLG